MKINSVLSINKHWKSVASTVLLRIPAGCPEVFIADRISVAKKDLKPGEVLDGEGGYTVFGRLVRADESVLRRYLPLGLSRGAKMVRAVAKDALLTYDDVVLDESTLVFALRKRMEEEARKDRPLP